MQVVASVVVLKNGPIKTIDITTRDEPKGVGLGELPLQRDQAHL
jgi:hypothetical protein